MHLDQLRVHGGLLGIRDENVLESALARPQQRWHYDKDVDLPGLAAAYGYGLAMNHPYRDGNKRIAFMALATFVLVNGLELDATEPDVVTVMLSLASGRLTEGDLAGWIRRHANV
jgi:death-on-curing protein